MDRSKRAIKKPRRFEDEAFESPAKVASQPSIATPKPPVSNGKNTITVKLPSASPAVDKKTSVVQDKKEVERKSIIKVKLTPKFRPKKLDDYAAESPNKSVTSQSPQQTAQPSSNKSESSVTASTPTTTIPSKTAPKITTTPKSATQSKQPASQLKQASTSKQTSSTNATAATPKQTTSTSKQTTSTPKQTTATSKQPTNLKPTTTPKPAPPETVKKSATQSSTTKPIIVNRKNAIKVKLGGVSTPVEKKSPIAQDKKEVERKSIIKPHLTPNLRPKNKLSITPPRIADLVPNVVLPFWDARTAAEEHEDDNVKELVHCHCSVAEELGLMVQCETCLTWQHAHCLGIEKPEDAPDGYTCQACSDPRHARESMKWAYDQDWLTKGIMKQFPCDPNPLPQEEVRILYQINKLIEALLHINKMIHSLKVKSRLLTKASDDDPDLKLFRVQWQPNYQHRDGTTFISTINHPSSTPTSTISAIGDSPDPGDIGVDPVTDGILPEIGQLDVSAILDSTYVTNPTTQQSMATSNQDATPDDCRANLKLHIQQTEEFIGMELSSIEEQFAQLEKQVGNDPFSADLGTSLSSLKNDLLTMKKYLKIKGEKF